jgi:hypothetical protein
MGPGRGWCPTVNVNLQCLMCVPGIYNLKRARKTRSAASRRVCGPFPLTPFPLRHGTSPRDRTGRWAARGAWRRDVLWL